jgi:hypothetical protein
MLGPGALVGSVHVTSRYRIDPRTDLRMLEAFYWVALRKNFHRAAEKLNTTQPAISKRIDQLETCLGDRLLVRDKRTVALTDKGGCCSRRSSVS